MTNQTSWWAKGLLFENCNCQIVCPGHFQFTQLCTYERCLGYWGICFEEGRFGDVSISGRKAVVVWDSPQLMISGDWTLTPYLDQDASDEQQHAIARILGGEANGPWKFLTRLVKEQKPIRRVAIEFSDAGREKKLSAGDFLRSTLVWLRGADKEKELLLENSFNQIHGSTQVLNMGTTDYTGAPYQLQTKGSHAVYSRYSWQGSC